ncbi:olfactory receptor 10J5-like [Clupea harengus]|uniref:Olfactory receptor n=1 Tax=Clupea harengus TaxID=7950 RepID=A0A6P8G3E1_CLUHA|nr:olfactory receptor 10J5-like [Clupea harengus]
MKNLTKISFIILTAYTDVGNVKYLYFTILLALYVCIIFANVLVIRVVCMDRSLHEPMYLFLCSLCVNELYGSTGLFPCLLVNLISHTHAISLTYCYLQMYCLYTYATVEYCNLSVMSYDRYMSICHPLQYNRIMTQRRVCILILLAWSYSFCQFTVTLSLNLRLQLCGNVMEKVWCDNYMLVRLSCSDTTVNNMYGLYATVLTICAPLVLMLYSYIRIIKITFRSSKSAKKKSLSTCAPHIVSLLNYSIGCSFEIIQSRLGKANIPSILRIIISIYFLMIPPLVNPIMYGLKMAKIREACKKVVCPRKSFF